MPEQRSETERNKAVVRRFIEEVQNQKDSPPGRRCSG
jgi:hypothetical protein